MPMNVQYIQHIFVSVCLCTFECVCGHVSACMCLACTLLQPFIAQLYTACTFAHMKHWQHSRLGEGVAFYTSSTVV